MHHIEVIIFILDLFPNYMGSDKLLRIIKMLDHHFDVIDKQINEIKALLSML
ncbi:hypothetical protein NIES4103_08670 [Nostoc sp. NIES-4103]|nr:hypothetical protein NIES4103_08670 [Nostoc sp. NIES-4103]